MSEDGVLAEYLPGKSNFVSYSVCWENWLNPVYRTGQPVKGLPIEFLPLGLKQPPGLSPLLSLG